MVVLVLVLFWSILHLRYKHFCFLMMMFSRFGVVVVADRGQSMSA